MSFAKLMLGVISALFIGSLVALGSLASAQSTQPTQQAQAAAQGGTQTTDGPWTTGWHAVELSATFFAYQVKLHLDLDDLQQKYLNTDFTKKIPNSVEGATENGAIGATVKGIQMATAVDDASRDLTNLRANVARYQQEQKDLANMAINGGHVVLMSVTSVQAMSNICKKYDIRNNPNFDPGKQIGQNYDDSIKEMSHANDLLWNAARDLYNVDHGSVGQVLKSSTDSKQQAIFQAHLAAVKTIKDLTNLKKQALLEYNNFVKSSKATRDAQDQENISLQQTCAQLQVNRQNGSSALQGQAPAPFQPGQH